MIKQRINPHAHSTESDGELTIEEIDMAARVKGIKQVVTDHNTVDAHRLFESDMIGAGIEVKTENGVDIIVSGSREGVIELFDEHLQPLVDPSNPIFGEINISPVELVGLAREMGHEILLPHPGTVEGATMLSIKTQEELARHDPLVESNGRMSRNMNRIAKEFARRLGLKLIAGGDSHIEGYNQYTTSYNQVKVEQDLPPEALLKTLRTKRKRHKMRVSKPSLRETLATGRQVLAKGGLKMLQMLAKYKGRQLFGTQY